MKQIITLTGPSGSGKSHLEKKLNGFAPSIVSTTTRPPREGEVNGVDYNFVSHDDFMRLIGKDFLLEHNQHAGNFYGICKSDLSRGTQVVVVDPNGARNIANYSSREDINVLSIYIDSPTEVLIERLLSRETVCGKTISSLAKRIDILTSQEVYWKNEHQWDVVIEAYNTETEAETISFIISEALSESESACVAS